MRFPLLTCMVAAAFALLAAGCNHETPGREPVRKIRVKTVRVAEKIMKEPVRCSGTLSTKTESRLSFKTGGIIREIMAGEGELVEEGKLLARLDLSEVRSHLDQAKLAWQKTRRDFERTRNLYRDSVATLEQYQDARTALDMARSRYDIAKFNLKYSEIRAPSQGKILRKIAGENEIVGAGHPVFLFGSTESEWVIRSNLADRDIVRVGMGDSASVYFDAWPEIHFAAHVSEIVTAADPYTGTYEVEMTLNEVPERLVSGFIARVRIYPQQGRKLLFIPAEALVDAGARSGNVWIAKDSTAERRRVDIRQITDEGIFVSRGIVPGERVITAGNAYLRKNSVIETVD